MFPLHGLAGVFPGGFKGGKPEGLDVQPVRESGGANVVGVGGLAPEQGLEDPARDAGVEQGAIGRDPEHHVGAGGFRGPIKPVQDVLLASGVAGRSAPGAQPPQGLVGGAVGNGHHHRVDAGDGAAAVHDPLQSGFSSQIQEDLSGKAGGAHAGLDDRDDFHGVRSLRPVRADLRAVSTSSRVLRASRGETRPSEAEFPRRRRKALVWAR